MKNTIPGRRSAAQLRIPHQVEPLLRQIGRIGETLHAPAYAVGGCVRDWWLGVANTVDLDVTVEGSGIEVARAAARSLGGTVQAHQQFGTATVLVAGPRRRRVDFATCRKETYATPAAYPRVAPGTLEEDLFRRDFTMNAIAAALSPARFGTLVDPFHGAQDLRRKQVRILHTQGFLDDPSRILRGIRFLHRFGFRWERKTQRLAREAVAAGALGWLNAGRLSRELDRMSREPNPLSCFQGLAALLDYTVKRDGRGPAAR